METNSVVTFRILWLKFNVDDFETLRWCLTDLSRLVLLFRHSLLVDLFGTFFSFLLSGESTNISKTLMVPMTSSSSDFDPGIVMSS